MCLSAGDTHHCGFLGVDLEATSTARQDQVKQSGNGKRHKEWRLRGAGKKRMRKKLGQNIFLFVTHWLSVYF